MDLSKCNQVPPAFQKKLSIFLPDSRALLRWHPRLAKRGARYSNDNFLSVFLQAETLPGSIVDMLCKTARCLLFLSYEDIRRLEKQRSYDH